MNTVVIPAGRRLRRPPARAATQSHPTRCLIADQNHLIRDLLMTLLQGLKGNVLALRAVGDAASMLETGREFQPDLLLMELSALQQPNSDDIHRVRRAMPRTRLLIYAVAATDDEIVEALRAGVDGFCSKSTSREQFLEAIDRLTRGENYFCARSNRLLAEIAQGKHSEAGAHGSVLSRREREILVLIAAGKTSKEIAAELHLSAATVDTHRRNAMSKVRARNAADLIRYGYDHGLLSNQRA